MADDDDFALLLALADEAETKECEADKSAAANTLSSDNNCEDAQGGGSKFEYLIVFVRLMASMQL